MSEKENNKMHFQPSGRALEMITGQIMRLLQQKPGLDPENLDLNVDKVNEIIINVFELLGHDAGEFVSGTSVDKPVQLGEGENVQS